MLDAGKLTDRIKALVPVLIPLFISAFRRADELAMAMECRCYRGFALYFWKAAVIASA